MSTIAGLIAGLTLVTSGPTESTKVISSAHGDLLLHIFDYVSVSASSNDGAGPIDTLQTGIEANFQAQFGGILRLSLASSIVTGEVYNCTYCRTRSFSGLALAPGLGLDIRRTNSQIGVSILARWPIRTWDIGYKTPQSRDQIDVSTIPTMDLAIGTLRQFMEFGLALDPWLGEGRLARIGYGFAASDEISVTLGAQLSARAALTDDGMQDGLGFFGIYGRLELATSKAVRILVRGELIGSWTLAIGAGFGFGYRYE